MHAYGISNRCVLPYQRNHYDFCKSVENSEWYQESNPTQQAIIDTVLYSPEVESLFKGRTTPNTRDAALKIVKRASSKLHRRRVAIRKSTPSAMRTRGISSKRLSSTLSSLDEKVTKMTRRGNHLR